MDNVIKDFSGLDITHQIVTFFIFFVIGVVFCGIYDIYRAIRCEIKPKKLIIFFADIIYTLFFTFIIFSASLVRSNGQIRIFALFGCLLGWFIIRFTVSKWICVFFRMIIRAIKRVIRFTNRKIVYPLRIKIPLYIERIKSKL